MPNDDEIRHIVAVNAGVETRLGKIQEDTIHPIRLRMLLLDDESELTDQLEEFDEWFAFFSGSPELKKACLRGRNRIVISVIPDKPIAACVQEAIDENTDIINLPFGGIEVVRQYSKANRLSEKHDRFLVPGSADVHTFGSMMDYLDAETAKHPILELHEQRSRIRTLFGELDSPDHGLLFT